MLSSLLGYNLGGKPEIPVTGSPTLDPIIAGIKANEINYIVVEDGQITDRADYV